MLTPCQAQTVVKDSLTPSAFASVTIQPRLFTYRPPGEFLQAGHPVAPPLIQAELPHALIVMKHLVTRRHYHKCVLAGGCKPPYEAYTRMDDSQQDADWEEPQTGVNYHDALAYISWLNQTTGANWRLPTDMEWAAFAGKRYFDDQVGDPKDPLKSSISEPPLYKSQLAGADLLSEEYYDPIPKKPGYFGANSLGVVDVSGNISEWTSGCYERHRLNASGQLQESQAHCGVRIVEGRQRAYLSTFMRDPSSGECTVAIPTLNLGIRLVRDAQSDLLTKVRQFLK